MDTDEEALRNALWIRHKETIRAALALNHREEYNTLAGFHTAINLLAEMLPYMVEGLAQQARREEQEMQAKVDSYIMERMREER